MKDFYQKLLNYSFWLLGRRAYSESELKKKLGFDKSGNSIVIIEKVLARLKELNYIDDEKYARQYIKSRLELNPRGKFLIWQELRRKKIAKEVFEKIWEEIGLDDEELAKRILARQERQLNRLPALKRKKKIVSLLASRGIAPGIIYDLAQKS